LFSYYSNNFKTVRYAPFPVFKERVCTITDDLFVCQVVLTEPEKIF
jgi:hypothetical protein